MIEVKSPILHNGRLYREGDVIADITPEQAAILVQVGSADWQRVRPAMNSDSGSMPNPSRGDEPQGNSGDVDWEAKVKPYHRGFGNYDIPGVGMVKGKEAAIEALKQQKQVE